MRLPWSLSRHPSLRDWFEVDADGVTVHTGKVEIGQGITTAIATIAAEELDLPLDQIRVVTGNTRHGPDELITAGSMSIEMGGTAVRQAAAHLRARAVQLVAGRLGVEADELQVADGLIRHAASNQSFTYMELADILDLDTPVETFVEEKSRDNYRQVGQFRQRVDLEKKIRGGGAFLQDLDIPGLLHARVIRAPSVAHKLRAIDTGKVPGDVTVVRNGDFIGVVGTDEWRVSKTRAALLRRADFDIESHLPADLFSWLEDHADEGLLVVDGTPVEGDLPPAPDMTDAIQATYRKPYYLHGSIGPSAAIACWDDGHLTVYSHTQGPFVLRAALAQALVLDESCVDVIHAENAGCYGHNGADDAAMDAALVALALPGQHVLLKWEREDEHLREPFSPAMQLSLRAQAADGRINVWMASVISQTHAGRPRLQPGASNLLASWEIDDGLPRPVPQPAMLRHVGIHRNADPLYNFEDRHIVKRLVRDTRIRTSSTRGLGAFGNIFAIESFMDEVAQQQGEDPVVFRLRHLADPRARDVIETAWAALSAFESRSPCNGKGLAFARYKNQQTYAAVAVAVAVDEATFELSLEHAVIAADAGFVIDPDGLANQLEGGFIQAASWTLKEAVQFDEAGSISVDWDSYPILRFSEVPTVDVHVIDQPDAPSLGAGEATQGPTPAAIANAVFNATGLRVRELPLTADRLRQVALKPSLGQ